MFNPLNAELNPIRHLLTLVGTQHIVHVGRVRGKNSTTFYRTSQVIAQSIQLLYFTGWTTELLFFHS